MTANPAFLDTDIKGLECKHAVYTIGQGDSKSDLLTIKENVHLKDGRVVPNLRFIKDYKRKFWITKEGCRDHKDKKECESINKLQSMETTQRNLLTAIARALGRGPIQGGLRRAAQSPYLYGCDVTTPVLIKQRYMSKYPDYITDNTIAVMDIEADTISPKGHPNFEKPIIVSLTFKSRAIMCVTKDFLKGIQHPEQTLQDAFEEYLGEYKKSREIDLEIRLVDKITDGIVHVINRAHEWMPDFVVFWNINYDMPKMIRDLEDDGYNLADVFSAPEVPHQFRYFQYKEGPADKKMASGKTMTLSPAERWHVVTCPASFYFIDAMCVYQKIRIAKGKESYALDDVLKKHLGIRKLKFKEADHLVKLGWHMFMQRNYPVQYCIYNLFDCISVELLDETTTDLSRTISLLCGFSEYMRFPSQPRRTCDDLHFFFQEHGCIAATTSDKMTDENDALVVGIKDWIVTLPSHLVVDCGLKVIKECPDASTLLFSQVADLDVAGTYPTEEIIMNISKATTKREMASIRGVSEHTRRMQGINLTGGHTNAVEICVGLFGAPSFSQMLEAFEKQAA